MHLPSSAGLEGATSDVRCIGRASGRGHLEPVLEVAQSLEELATALKLGEVAAALACLEVSLGASSLVAVVGSL